MASDVWPRAHLLITQLYPDHPRQADLRAVFDARMRQAYRRSHFHLIQGLN